MLTTLLLSVGFVGLACTLSLIAGLLLGGQRDI